MSCRYLTGLSDDTIRLAAQTYLFGRLGIMLGPATAGGPGSKDDYSRHIPDYQDWAFDNGCFSNRGAFDQEAWLTRLAYLIDNIDGAHLSCRFAVAPDVFYPDRQVGDQLATIESSRPVLREIRRLGVPAALVIQDGLHAIPLDDLPWPDFDVAFLGGSDMLKLGYPVRHRSVTYRYDRFRPESIYWAAFLQRCHQEGKPIHVGRVSSAVRMQLAREIWADTADGTYLLFRGVARGLADIDSWTRPEVHDGIQAT